MVVKVTRYCPVCKHTTKHLLGKTIVCLRCKRRK